MSEIMIVMMSRKYRILMVQVLTVRILTAVTRTMSSMTGTCQLMIPTGT
jgi:hypothetical protein